MIKSTRHRIVKYQISLTGMLGVRIRKARVPVKVNFKEANWQLIRVVPIILIAHGIRLGGGGYLKCK